MVPADDQAMVFPCASVMVIIVLLKLAFTCATPEAIFLRSRRRTRVASLPIHDPFAGGVRRCAARTSLFRTLRLSSCRQSPSPAPCGSGHWCGSAGREPVAHVDAATRGSTQ